MAAELMIGDYFCKITKSSILGSGQYAIVYKGKHITKNIPVAIKIVKFNATEHTYAEELIYKFLKLRHKNIIAVLATLNVRDDSRYLTYVMEFCNRGNLDTYIQNEGPLSVHTIRVFLKQIAEALKFLHGKGVIHRDLKPENIFLCSSEPNPDPEEITFKIGDFGTSTIPYVAPEIILDSKIDNKVDLWSIGVIIFECLTKEHPYNNKGFNLYKDLNEFADPPRIPNNTPKPLKDLIVHCLKKNPDNRIDSESFCNHEFICCPDEMELSESSSFGWETGSSSSSAVLPLQLQLQLPSTSTGNSIDHCVRNYQGVKYYIYTKTGKPVSKAEQSRIYEYNRGETLIDGKTWYYCLLHSDCKFGLKDNKKSINQHMFAELFYTKCSECCDNNILSHINAIYYHVKSVHAQK